MSDGPAFQIGMHLIDFPAPDPAETPTARDERIRAKQEAWSPRDVPGVSPGAVLAELAAQNPQFRMGAFMAKVANDPAMIPVAEVEPGPGEEPQPGGLIEQMRETIADRTARARRGFIR